MDESLPYDQLLFDKNVVVVDKLITPDDSNIGYFIENDWNYPDKTKGK